MIVLYSRSKNTQKPSNNLNCASKYVNEMSTLKLGKGLLGTMMLQVGFLSAWVGRKTAATIGIVMGYQWMMFLFYYCCFLLFHEKQSP